MRFCVVFFRVGLYLRACVFLYAFLIWLVLCVCVCFSFVSLGRFARGCVRLRCVRLCIFFWSQFVRACPCVLCLWMLA